MNKLDMAHEYLRDIISNWEYDESFNPVAEAWKYADAMQAEADKREQEQAIKDAELSKQFFDSLTKKQNNDWQPDWSKAPKDKPITEWQITEMGKPVWIWYSKGSPIYISAPSFNYQGDWKQSLRKRPETKPIKEKPKQHKCNCAHWKGSSFFMGDTFTCNDCGGTVTI